MKDRHISCTYIYAERKEWNSGELWKVGSESTERERERETLKKNDKKDEQVNDRSTCICFISFILSVEWIKYFLHLFLTLEEDHLKFSSVYRVIKSFF